MGMLTERSAVLKKTIFWLLLILWVALLVVLSRQSGEETAELSGGLSGWIVGVLAQIGIEAEQNAVHRLLRLGAHVFLYLVLGFLVSRAMHLSFRGRWVSAAIPVICLVISFLDEYQKAFIPGRHCQWDEAALNFVCSMVGAAVGRVVHRLRGAAPKTTES